MRCFHRRLHPLDGEGEFVDRMIADTGRILDRAADRSGLATGLNGSSGSEEPVGVGGEASLEELEAAHIKRVLERCKTMKEAADTLGINKATLYRKRLKLNLD